MGVRSIGATARTRRASRSTIDYLEGDTGVKMAEEITEPAPVVGLRAAVRVKKSVRFDASVVGGEPKPRPSRPTSAQSTPPPTPAKGCGAKGRGGGQGKGVGVRGRGTFMLFMALFGGFCSRVLHQPG